MNHMRTVVLSLIAIAVVVPATASDRLDRSLRGVVSAADPIRFAADRGFAVRDGRVQVVAVTGENDPGELTRWLERRGATFVGGFGNRVQAFVPPSLLVDLGRRSDVVYVERPLYAELPEPTPEAAPFTPKILAVVSEGVEEMNVAAWRAEGFTGAGVRVGVIDVEFGGWEDLVGVELPPAERTTYRAFGGAGVVADQVHGTACAEIVHDIAPDAELLLAHIRTVNDLFSALDWLAAEGVDVVTMSIGWYGAGPGDGSGAIAEEINAFVTAADAVFLNSAGNERLSHWQGATADADNDDWVDFAPGDNLNELTFAMAPGDRVAVNLVWADWDSPDSDYDLHLYRIDGGEVEEVAVSSRPQSGQSWQTPYEQISYTTPDGGNFAVRVNRAGVSGVHDMELFSIDSDVSNRVAEGSLTIPTDASGVVGVAAVSYNPPYTYRSYSSAGPANGPGGTLTGGDTKPDLAGYDGVSTVSYGARNFFGTSAAAPHAAGAAAVVQSAEPTWGGTEVRAFLETRALDLGPGGQDNDYGWGRAFLGASPGSDCSYSIDPVTATVSAAGGGGIIHVTTDEGCPWNTSSRVDWMTVAPSTGTGDGVVGFTVEANNGAAREGEAIIADLTFTVSQAGAGCEFVVTPPSQSFPGGGGSGLFSVESGVGCEWTATTGDGWILITSGTGSGNGTVLFDVAFNDGPQRTGTITVGDADFTVIQAAASPERSYTVAGIAETEGAAQTRWKSDLAILNPGATPTEVELRYRHDRGLSLSSAYVAAGAVVELPNVAVETFAAADSAGAVEVRSDTELIVTARTFNDAAAGTFGQFLPGVVVGEGLSGTEVAVLSQLTSGSGFRTNIGFVDLGGVGAVARVRLYDRAGEPVGSELGEIIPPGGWVQINRAFHEANVGGCSGCYALVDLVNGEGEIWAYASVVDNASGDPTTVPMVKIDGADVTTDHRYLVAGVAETDGANQTTWKTNLALLNLSGAGVSAELEYRYGSNSSTSSLVLASGELREFANIAADLFGASGTAGAVEVDADGPLVVTARTFNDSTNGTFGQFLPGLGAAEALTPGTDGLLSQLKSTDDFRTNIGFTNYSGVECTVRTFLHDDQGDRKGVLMATVPAGGWLQLNRVFEISGVGPCPLGYAVVEVLTGGCQVWAYASVVDNGSGDPTTIPVVPGTTFGLDGAGDPRQVRR